MEDLLGATGALSCVQCTSSWLAHSLDSVALSHLLTLTLLTCC